jgi:hypothetical protein
MDRKNTKKNDVAGSKSQKGKKKLEVSASKSRRINESKRVKAKDTPASPDSSSSDEIHENYVEFLKTYDPQESYLYDCPSGEEGSQQVIVESKAKTPKSPKMKSSK